MNQLLGFASFWLGCGMLLQFFLPDKLWAFVLAVGLMLLGYYMFCQDKA